MPVFMYQSLPPKSFLQSAHHTLQYILPEFSCCRKKFCWNLNLLVYKKPYVGFVRGIPIEMEEAAYMAGAVKG